MHLSAGLSLGQERPQGADIDPSLGHSSITGGADGHYGVLVPFPPIYKAHTPPPAGGIQLQAVIGARHRDKRDADITHPANALAVSRGR